MINPIHILQGWFASLIWASSATIRLSIERLKECKKCENTTQSSLLKIVKGSFEEINCLRCNSCGCPIVEKSMVKDEKCPLNKWKQ